MPFILPEYQTCFFCECLAGSRQWIPVDERETVVAIVNPRQYERGAILIIPRAHRETILDIEPREIEAAYRLARRLARAAERALGAIGANVFQNNGVKGGQHEPHFHVHVVPRYERSDSDVVFLQRNYAVAPDTVLHEIATLMRSALSEDS